MNNKATTNRLHQLTSAVTDLNSAIVEVNAAIDGAEGTDKVVLLTNLRGLQAQHVRAESALRTYTMAVECLE
tara:strand:- start:103 stop:318 length:216 start_codon:yes stop_codon:yes gene_type:complete